MLRVSSWQGQLVVIRGRARALLAVTLMFPTLVNVHAKDADNPMGVEIELPVADVTNSVWLDGAGHDALWSRAVTLPALTLTTGGAEHEGRGSTVRAVRAGTWLFLALDADEPDGIVAQESIHGADLWFDDAFGIQLKGTKSVELMVNPLGSVWCNIDGNSDPEPLGRSAILAAARITKNHWRAEIAIDLREVDPDARFEFQVYRQRQQRGSTPFEHAETPRGGSKFIVSSTRVDAAQNVRVAVAPPEHYFGAAILETVRCGEAPATAAAWSAMPVVLLREESGAAVLDPDFQSTEVRSALTKDALLLHIVCREAHPDSLPEPRDGDGIWNQDNIEVFLGPERFGYLQIAANPFGKTEASLGKSGGRRVKSIPLPGGVTVSAARGAEAWTLDFSIPLESVCSALQLPPTRAPEIYPWWIQISRTRPARENLGQIEQVSLLSVTRSATAHCPLRFGLLRVGEASKQPIPTPEIAKAELPDSVLTREQRGELKASKLLESWIAARRTKLHQKFEDEFAKIDNAEAWRTFANHVRAELMRAMFPESGGVLPERTALDARVVYTHVGDGFQVQGVLFQSRPGLLVPVTVYSPLTKAAAGVQRPALVMIPAHHTPRNNNDLQIVGANFARAGGVVLAIESIGTGERSVTSLSEHQSYQRHVVGTQLLLAGTELAGWTAWDMSRAADYLLQRGDIDPRRLGILGGVAGGGDLSALAAAVDERFTLSIPFNFSTIEPFGGYCDPCRTYVGSQTGGFTPWMTDALVAPRRLIMAQEFDWRPENQESFARFKKVYTLLGAEQNLASLHGGTNTHATHFNTMHRLPMYTIINGWYSMKLPENDAEEFRKIMPIGSLECFTTADGSAYVDELARKNALREPQQIASEMARAHLELSRARRAKDGSLQDDMTRLLGSTAPVAVDEKSIQRVPLEPWRGAAVDGFWIPAEEKSEDAKLGLALWILKPAAAKNPSPFVLCVAQAGKARFLADRAAEVEALLQSGVAVALLDVRGNGETAPSRTQLPEGALATLAAELWTQSDSLPARQLKDVRTALRFLSRREGLDATRMALWGEALNDPDGSASEAVLFDETGFRQTSPTPRQFVEPAGGFLVLLAALYPIEMDGGKVVFPKVVLTRGTVASFASVLERRHHYVPVDAVIPGLLNVADVRDVVAALRANHVEVLAEDLRDCSNRSLSAEDVQKEWGENVPPHYMTFPTPRATESLLRNLTH